MSRVRLGDVVDSVLAEDAPATDLREHATRVLDVILALGRRHARTLYEEIAEDPGGRGTLARRGLRPGMGSTLDLGAAPVEELAVPAGPPLPASHLRFPTVAEMVLDSRRGLEEVRRPAPAADRAGSPGAASRFASIGTLDPFRVDALEEVRSGRSQPVSDNSRRPQLLQRMCNGMVQAANYYEFDTVIYVAETFI